MFRLVYGQGMVTVADSSTLCDQVQPYFDSGLNCLILNMAANASPEDVRLAGETLSARFGVSE
jgi:hypothetical protein